VGGFQKFIMKGTTKPNIYQLGLFLMLFKGQTGDFSKDLDVVRMT
jgi:hypothetical protein